MIKWANSQPCPFLKGVCHKIFDIHFFHDSNPSRPLIKRLENFRIRFQFHRDIWIFKKLRGVHHTGESSDLKFFITPRCASHRGVRLCGVHPTAESSYTVCIIPRSLTSRCASHCGVNNLPSVCFDPKFYRHYFSVMPEDITMKIIM